ncbi:MAG TPA: 2-oxo acid dehydrogenase subunit E2 [Steroidobacteraceae bacterium]
MARQIEVRVPDMGDFKDVTVIDVLVKPGDVIETDAPLVTLETEKAAMDVPSTAAGVIDKVHVAKSSKVSPGDLLVTVRSDARAPEPKAAVAAAPAAPAEPPAAVPDAPPTAAAAPVPVAVSVPASPRPAPIFNELGFAKAHAGPSVRKLAREMGVDLSLVTGTGPRSRIRHDDVKAYIKRLLGAGAQGAATAAALPKVPLVDFSQFGAVEAKPLSRLQRISGPRLHASWVNIPHVTQFEDADVTDLEDVRGKLKQKAALEGIKLSVLAFVVRACARALQEFPDFNASLDEHAQNLILKKYIHIGFAADTPNGLVVPVLRDAERCDVYEIARRLGELAEKARAGKLKAAEMQGGSFTISSLGGIGGTAFTPIINAPEVAILGLSRSSMRPVYRDGTLVPRMILPLCLSYDHRVIDGASAARFTNYLAATLAEPRALVEAVP